MEFETLGFLGRSLDVRHPDVGARGGRLRVGDPEPRKASAWKFGDVRVAQFGVWTVEGPAVGAPVEPGCGLGVGVTISR